MNHRRTNAPVRFCSQCGEVVNGDLSTKRCSLEEHARRRRDREVFCVQCGERLVTQR